MTADLIHLLLLLAAIPVVAAIALFFYWLGHRHGRLSVLHHSSAPEPEHKAQPAPPQIPAYRINELATLLELGILTPEEFEAENDKIFAVRSA